MASEPTPSAEPSGDVHIRRVTEAEEYEACVAVQRSAWGETFTDLLPASHLQIAHETGGIVAGAFGDGDRLLGFVFGVPALEDGTVYHWSHMLAVRPEARGRGLGIGLKLRQRELLLDRGVRTARWTFDPLEARNAHINLNRLGCRVESYEVDLYGRHTGSPLHDGLGTDRFVVVWNLTSRRVERALARGGAPDLQRFRSAPAVGNSDLDEADRPVTTGAERVRVPIPTRIQEEKAADAQSGRRWRRRSRRALLWYLERGYEVAGLRRPAGSSRAAYYCLERGTD
jgi:predicted GNAT superfamily acetyltransferase